MSRRLIAVGLGLALAAAWAPALADQNVQIRHVELDDFPTVAVMVSVQGSAGFGAGEVKVLENDVAVPVTAVRPIGPTDQGVDVVLAVDTSNSMRGAPLRTAFAAAREFVTRIPPWVRVGLLTFADRPQIVQAITSDHEAVLRSLASPPPTAIGTALYDAVVTASGMFTETAQRNIVLLTDGRNTAGVGDLQAAAAAARDAHATIFSVALEGAETDISTLQQLAQLTSGTYASASPDDVGAAYRSLATELSQQYRITYRSRAPYGTQATVRVEVPVGVDEVAFLAPALGSGTSGGTETLTPLRRLFQGPLGLVTTVGLSFLAALGLVSLLLGLQARSSRERQLAVRMAAPPRARATPPPRQERNPLTSWIPQPVVGAAGRVARYTGLAARLDSRLEQAGVSMRPGEFLAGAGLAALVGGLVGGLASRNLLVALLLIAVGGVVPWLLLARAARKRTGQLQAQLPDVLMVIASSMRAGHSFMQALDMVTKEIGEPSASEFVRAVTEIRVGSPVEEALDALAERAGSEDFRWAVMAINIQRKVGGNLAEILETVAETIRERETIRRQVRVLSAEGRLSVAILTVLPFLLAAYLLLVVPSYIQPLFETSIGIVLLGGAGVLMLFGFWWMRRVVRLDV